MATNSNKQLRAMLVATGIEIYERSATAIPALRSFWSKNGENRAGQITTTDAAENNNDDNLTVAKVKRVDFFQ